MAMKSFHKIHDTCKIEATGNTIRCVTCNITVAVWNVVTPIIPIRVELELDYQTGTLR